MRSSERGPERIRSIERVERARVLDLPTKDCATCGRAFAWRKKWARCWDEVRHCSDACRRRRPSGLDRALEAAIEVLLARRPREATICPSEAARAVAEDWRPLMERARCAARRLAAQGRVEVTQGGRVVDAKTAKGPIRIRLAVGMSRALGPQPAAQTLVSGMPSSQLKST